MHRDAPTQPTMCTAITLNRRMRKALVAASTVVLALLAACGGGSGVASDFLGGGSDDDGDNDSNVATGYVARPLVSNVAGAPNVDPNLVNGWGVAFNPQGFVWVSAQGTSTSTLYDGNGVPQTLVVSIPAGQAGAAAPTGIVFNGSLDFQVSQGGRTGASAFIFAGEAGTIAGWSPSVNMNAAITVFDDGAAGTLYTGLALANRAGANFLYAADFRNGKVDVFNGSFQKVAAAGGFVDPELPAGYAPFGIQAIGSSLYVTFAQRDTGGRDAVKGAGIGIVDEFDTAGTLVRRFVTGAQLNAPWGLALAPANFGAVSNALLVGNFGNGRINAFSVSNGTHLGALSTDDVPITIDGLWGIAFGNGINAQPTNTLFYAAGPALETQGAYGRIDAQ